MKNSAGVSIGNRSSWAFRLVMAAGLAVSGLALSALAHAADGVPIGPDGAGPAVARLPASRPGGEALRRLNVVQLAQIAERYRMTPGRLADILRDDRTAWLDKDDELFYVERPPSHDPARTGSEQGRAAAAVLNLSQTFLLHSRPGSNRVVYLDFNGHSVAGTAWNDGARIDAPGFDLDGNPGAFSDTEKTRIQQIWQRVAEDFAPFDVDVTTQEPGEDAIDRTAESDQNYGTRAVITRTDIGVCGGCGGVAYVGIFDRVLSGDSRGFFQPAWVLYDVLGNGDDRFVAEATSHEVGHNLGLHHDGIQGGEEYYEGHGSGPTGWAPIMGVGYQRLLTQWSRGEYPNANNPQDDLVVIPSFGAPTRSDDHGNGTGTATTLTGTLSGGTRNISQAGNITTRSDVDYFSFDMRAGSLSLRAAPASRGPNLDLLLSLYNSAGDRVAVSGNPANEPDAVDASLSASLPAGRYFIKIDGVGDADPAPGYSDYASLGQYTITGTYPVAAGDASPTAVIAATPTSGTAPLAVQFDGSDSSDTEDSIAVYAWTFGDGATSSQINPSHTYAAAGTYTAQLTVTDTSDRQDVASLSITVTATTKKIFVNKIAMSVNQSSTGHQCTAKVTIKSPTGALVSGAKVTGRWTGVNTSIGSQSTTSKGVASLKNSRSSKRGTCTFSVTGVSKSGFSYDPAQNLETSDSLRY